VRHFSVCVCVSGVGGKASDKQVFVHVSKHLSMVMHTFRAYSGLCAMTKSNSKY